MKTVGSLMIKHGWLACIGAIVAIAVEVEHVVNHYSRFKFYPKGDNLLDIDNPCTLALIGQSFVGD